MKVVESLKGLLLFPFLAIGVPLALLLRSIDNKVERTPEDVEKILREMLAGTVSDDMWDEFLSVPIKNSKLDKFRERAEVLWAYEEFQTKNEKGYYVLNEKGLAELSGIIGDLSGL